MSIEGVSTTSIASIIIAALGISIASFLGGSFLQPMFQNHQLVAAIAYDIASMYDIAYTMPGEVDLYYYGPSACSWNHNLDDDNIDAFSCYGSNNVLLRDVYIVQEYVYLFNDPYMIYDYNNVDEAYRLPPESIYYPRPMSISIQIPFFDSQYDYFNENIEELNYGSFSKAIASASFTDIDLLVGEEFTNVVVDDYSFVISKHNVENYYYTLSSDYQQNLDSLPKFLILISELTNNLCNNEEYLGDDFFVYRNGEGKVVDEATKDSTTEADFVNLVKGYRWQIYEGNTICQERLMVDDYSGVLINDSNYEYENTIINGMKLNNYVVEYCFNISSLKGICENIDDVKFSENFENYVNNEYVYYAGFSSCLKPFLSYNKTTNDLTIDGKNVKYVVISGECKNV